MSASGLVVVPRARGGLSLCSEEGVSSRDQMQVRRRSSGNDVTLTMAVLGSLYDQQQQQQHRCRSFADLSKKDVCTVDTGDKVCSRAAASHPLQARGGEGGAVDDSHSNANNNLDYCYIWNTGTGTGTNAGYGVDDTPAPVLPPKQRVSSGRRLCGDTGDNIRHVSQSLDQLHVIGGASGLSLLPADDCRGSVAVLGSTESWRGGGGVPPLPPPPRPLRKSSASSSSSSTLPKPRPTTANNTYSVNLPARPTSAVQKTATTCSSEPLSTLPPSLPRKTRPRHLSSVQEGVQHGLALDLPSPTTNVLRPRSGREYAVPDRRRLAEEFGSKLTNSTASLNSSRRSSDLASSPSTMFTFDSAPTASPSVAASAASSSGSTTPPSPTNNDVVGSLPSSGIATPSPSNSFFGPTNHTPPPRPAGRELVNVCLPHASPKCLPQQSPPLNYIQLEQLASDVNDRSRSSRPASVSVPIPAAATAGSRAASGGVDYAVIDMVATVAALQVGREHVRQREDGLRARLLLQDEARDSRHLADALPPSRSSSRLTSSSKHSSRTSLSGSKDNRKLSLALGSRESSNRGSTDQRKLSSHQ